MQTKVRARLQKMHTHTHIRTHTLVADPELANQSCRTDYLVQRDRTSQLPIPEGSGTDGTGASVSDVFSAMLKVEAIPEVTNYAQLKYLGSETKNVG